MGWVRVEVTGNNGRKYRKERQEKSLMYRVCLLKSLLAAGVG